MKTKVFYIQPKIKNLLVDTENLAGLPATGPDDPTVGAKGTDGFDATSESQTPVYKLRSVWDEYYVRIMNNKKKLNRHSLICADAVFV